MGRFRQGIFIPDNPDKYVGDVNNIVFRSSWELKFMRNLDKHQYVLKWQSEELVIPYFSKFDNKNRRYFVDFVVLVQLADGSTKSYIVEVKPKKQTCEPVPPKRKTHKAMMRYEKELIDWQVNSDKWEAARAFASKVGSEFITVTEDDLF